MVPYRSFKKAIVITFATLSLFLKSADAQDIKIASLTIPKLFDDRDTGVYADVLHQITKDYEHNVEVAFLPHARLLRDLNANRFDCTYVATNSPPKWQDNGLDPQKWIFVGPVATVNIVAFIRADSPDIKSIEDIKDKLIAVDVNLRGVLTKLGVEWKYSTQSQFQLARMLARKRVDVVIGYDADFVDIFRNNPELQNLKEASYVIESVEDGLLCADTEKTAKFRMHADNVLNQLRSSGWLQNKFDPSSSVE